MWVLDYPEYCLVNVGRASGKVKLCLLDKENSWIGEKFYLRAVLMSNISREQPCSVQVLALSKDLPVGLQNVTTVERIVWQLNHRKPLSHRQAVRHINNNMMDNRASNLTLVDSQENVERSASEVSMSLYTSCVSQLIDSLPWLNVPDCLHTLTTQDTEADNLFCALVSSNNQTVSDRLTNRMETSTPLHECHYPACTRLESKPQQFDSCGGCRSLRYCSAQCQRLDWVIHQPHCQLIQSYQSQSQLSRLQDILYLNQQMRAPGAAGDTTNQRISNQHIFNQSIEAEHWSHTDAFSKKTETVDADSDYFIVER